jgi:hypothetical protein
MLQDDPKQNYQRSDKQNMRLIRVKIWQHKLPLPKMRDVYTQYNFPRVLAILETFKEKRVKAPEMLRCANIS